MPGKVVRATGYVVSTLCSQVASTKEINLCSRISLPDDLHAAILLHPRHTVFHSSFCSSVFICIPLFFRRHCEFCPIGERNTEVYTLCAGVGVALQINTALQIVEMYFFPLSPIGRIKILTYLIWGYFGAAIFDCIIRSCDLFYWFI